MALITCPECGGKVSDKANVCIHCGFPLDKINTTNTSSVLNEQYQYYKVLFDKFISPLDRDKYIFKVQKFLKTLKDTNSDKVINRIIGSTNSPIALSITYDNAKWLQDELRKYGCSVIIQKTYSKDTSKENEIIDKLINNKQIINDAPIVCPKCKSTQVVIGTRGFSMITGFVGSNKTTNRCGKCGYKWQPR